MEQQYNLPAQSNNNNAPKSFNLESSPESTMKHTGSVLSKDGFLSKKFRVADLKPRKVSLAT